MTVHFSYQTPTLPRARKHFQFRCAGLLPRLSRMLLLAVAPVLLTLTSPAMAGGEAGPISLREQGNFFVGIETTEPERNGAVHVLNQMYVGYQLVAEPQHDYPIILVHGGGGQASDWFTTPDGRDGWRDYFLAAGFDVYWVDRPGYGRSPTNTAYGELRESASSSIISFLAQSEQFPGDPDDHLDPMILDMLAGSPPGPYGGNKLAARDLSLLLERIGPAILVTYSAGAISGWWAADTSPDKVAGIVAVEPASSNITSRLGKQLTFDPPLAEDFEAVEDAEGCDLQPGDNVSTLPSFHDMPIYLIGAEFGLIRGLPCSAKAFRQAGADARYIYLPDLGIHGNGHLLPNELNNGETADVIIDIMAEIP